MAGIQQTNQLLAETVPQELNRSQLSRQEERNQRELPGIKNSLKAIQIATACQSK